MILNGQANTHVDTLGNLANQLTDPGDRQTYGELISYVRRLPAGDEFRNLAEMLGFMALLTGRLPDAVASLLLELRAQSTMAADYHGQLNGYLATLPAKIAKELDPLAKSMGETFRQQIAAAGLREIADSVKLSADQVKPLAGQLEGVTATISTQLAHLRVASEKLQAHNSRLIQQRRKYGWMWQALAGLVLLLGGIMLGALVRT